MLGRFARRLFARNPHLELRHAAAGTTELPPAARVACRPADPPRPAPVDPTQKLEALLVEESRASLEVLASAVTNDGKTSDARLLLDDLKESIAGLRLPSDPIPELLALCRDGATDEHALAARVMGDPAWVRAVVEYAQGGNPVSSPAEAISAAGRDGVRNAVLHAALERVVLGLGVAAPPLTSLTWAHMLRTSRLARALAPSFQFSEEDGYAVGLLHDVGKLVVFERIATLRRQLRRDLVVPYSLVRALLRMLHEDLGALTALQWGLGAPIATAIACHHREPPPLIPNVASEVAFLAERLDHAMQRRTTTALRDLWDRGALGGSIESAEATLAAWPAAPAVGGDPGARQQTSAGTGVRPFADAAA